MNLQKKDESIKDYFATYSWWIIGSLLLLITALATFLRFHEIGKLSFWNDELATLLYINHSVGGMFAIIWPREMNMVLYYLITNLWLHLFSNPSEGILRSISAIFSIACIPAIFFLGRTVSTNKKFGNTVGLISALFITLNAFQIEYAQELRTYSLVCLLAILSTFSLIKALEKPESIKRWLCYVFISVAGIYSFYFMGLVLVAQVLTLPFLLSLMGRNFPFKKIFFSYFLIGLLIIPLLIASSKTGAGNLFWIPKPTFNSLLQFGISITGGTNILLPLLYCIGLITAVFFNRTKSEQDIFDKWTPTLFLTCLFLPLFIILFISEIRTPLFVDRYFIFSIPFFSIIVAIGITKLLYKAEWTFKVLGFLLMLLIVISSVIGVQDYFKNNKKENWKDMSGFLAKNCMTSGGVRIYYPTFIQANISYYNNDLFTQNPPLENALENPDANYIAGLIPPNTQSICLSYRVSDAMGNPKQMKVLQNALGNKLKNLTVTKFWGLEVEIYSK